MYEHRRGGEHMAKGKKRPAELPEYGTVMMKGVQYYRTRITDADGNDLCKRRKACETARGFDG